MSHVRAEEVPINRMLRSRFRAGGIALVLGVGSGVLIVLLALHGTREAVQDVDDEVLHFMVRIRLAPVTWIALALNVLGSGIVTEPEEAAGEMQEQPGPLETAATDDEAVT
jgi:hypothetical protein